MRLGAENLKKHKIDTKRGKLKSSMNQYYSQHSLVGPIIVRREGKTISIKKLTDKLIIKIKINKSHSFCAGLLLIAVTHIRPFQTSSVLLNSKMQAKELKLRHRHHIVS